MSYAWFLRISAMRKALALILVFALSCFLLLPLFTLLIWAFADQWTFPSLLPQQVGLRWWQWVFHNGDLGNAIKLSFEFAPIVTIASAAICLPAAYAFSRFRFPLRRPLFVSLLAINAFPKIGLYISVAALFYRLNLMDTFLGVVLVQLINTLVSMTWIPTAAFNSIAPELEEAAHDVGARGWRVFWRITFPLALPGIIVASILAFLASLDEAQGTLVVGTPSHITMPVIMYTLVSNYPQPVGAVFSILLSLPSLVLLISARRFLTAGYLAAGFRVK
ncbi:MAG: ABC transporter permease subunit [Chloroflexi bacterium]|nr:ABC transporter permease subunit [Chloroflexota bacterium]